MQAAISAVGAPIFGGEVKLAERNKLVGKFDDVLVATRRSLVPNNGKPIRNARAVDG